MAHINFPSASSNVVDAGTQTDHDKVEIKTTLPKETTVEERAAMMKKLFHTSGSHPLKYQRISTDAVTKSTVAQAMQTIFGAHSRRSFTSGSHVDASMQTLHHDSIRTLSYQNVQALFKGIDNQTSIGLEQDPEMTREFAEASSFPAPKGTKASDCICLPPDLMAYRLDLGNGQHTLRYNCPEINGTGFGGIRDIPPEQLQVIMRGYQQAGKDIARECAAKNEVPLVIVANSGREGAIRNADGNYPASSNSKMIWEKAYVADVIAEGIGSEEHPVFADSLDKFVTQYNADIDKINSDFSLTPQQRKAAKDDAYAQATVRMAEHKDEPLVLLGYSRDMAACCKIVDNVPNLFGRPVHGAVNDRALQNLALTEKQELDFKKFSPMNATIKEGVDKFEAALARAKFLDSPEFANLAKIAEERGFKFTPRGLEQVRHFPKGHVEDLEGKTDFEKKEIRSTYFRAVNEQDETMADVVAAWDEFNAIGLKPLFKPNGTGQSKGILAPKTGETKEQFLESFKKNMVEIEKSFGKGAGYPFMVMPLLKLDETPKNEAYDLRFATYQNVDDVDNPTLHSIPLILKKEPPKTTPYTGELEFTPTNVTAAVAKTGGKGTDFIVPLSSQAGLDQSGLSKDEMKSMGLYFSAFQSWLLENEYSRKETSASVVDYYSDNED
jgi:hypothetical protein